MKKILFLFVLSAAISCRNSDKLQELSNADTMAAPAIKVQNPDSLNTGIWEARMERISTEKGEMRKLTIIGTFEPEKPNAKVVLTRATTARQTNASELVLVLSKMPTKKTRAPVKVDYEEIMAQNEEGKYKKVRILYHDKTIATISAIKGLQ